MVVDGLFEVEAVGANLGFGLLQDDFPAAGLPAGSVGDLRTEQANGEERHTFAEQMRVGGEVGGQKALDVPAVEVESGEQAVVEISN